MRSKIIYAILLIFILSGCINKEKEDKKDLDVGSKTSINSEQASSKQYKAVEEKRIKEFFETYDKVDKKLLKIFDNATELMREYKYKQAITELEKIEKVKPSFNVIGLNVNMLLGRCYEDLGDLDTAMIYYNNSNKYFEKSIFDEVYGYSYREAFALRFFIKVKDWEKAGMLLERSDNAINILNEMYNSDFYEKYKGTKLEEELLGRFSSLMYDAQLDSLINSITPTKDGKYDENQTKIHIEHFWKQISNLQDEDSLMNAFFYMLNYKLYDDSYPSDIVWERDITKEYFKEFCSKKLITKNTLKKLREVLPRKEMPQSFVDLFNDCKN